MIIRRFKRRIAELREEPEETRWRAASRWTMMSGGVLALLWVSILLPLQVSSRHDRSRDVNTETVPAGSVQGVQDSVATPSPTIAPQLYHGTRPTQRQSAELSPYVITTPTPTPSPTPEPTPAEEE